MAGLNARRAGEMAVLCKSIFAMELLVAAQAAELRGKKPLGTATSELLSFVREIVPFTQAGQTVPRIQPLLDHIAAHPDRIEKLFQNNNQV